MRLNVLHLSDFKGEGSIISMPFLFIRAAANQDNTGGSSGAFRRRYSNKSVTELTVRVDTLLSPL